MMFDFVFPGYDLIDDDEQNVFEIRDMNHANMVVTNVEASKRFYCGVLGNERKLFVQGQSFQFRTGEEVGIR
ncbi:MAG: hypothetical protein JXA42_03710 [Anaerolineales bacterium]|nr:hypothetical protein [Anaerolineales bacterium]